MNSLARQNILVVDDELPVRELMQAFLERRGYHVVTAATDLEALHVAGEVNFDLAIFDVALSDADGLELLAMFKQLYPELPVIMLTTESQESKKAEGKAAGAKAWITKPFQPSQLVDAISRLSV